MKKTISIISAILLAFSLASCGAAQDDVPSETQNNTSASETDVNNSAEASGLLAFSADTVDGATITGNVFTEHEITMVNIWATWCPPCVGEMPDLAVVYSQLPEGAGMISVCIDGDSMPETAKDILSDAGCTFPAVIPDKVLNDELLESVMAIPTTFFISSTGEIIGEPRVGSADAKMYLDLIDSALTAVR